MSWPSWNYCCAKQVGQTIVRVIWWNKKKKETHAHLIRLLMNNNACDGNSGNIAHLSGNLCKYCSANENYHVVYW